MRKRFLLLFATLAALSGSVTLAPSVAAAAPPVSPVAVTSFAYGGGTSAEKFKTSWSWYVARASGLLAGVLLAVLVVSGVGMLTGLTYKLFEPLPAWVLHRAVGLSFGVMVLIHMLVLLFDRFIGFSLADVLVPFASTYKPLMVGGVSLGSFYVAIGVLAFYAIVIVIASSLLWMQRKPHTWRWLHFLSYGILVLVFVHGLFLGSDVKQGWGRWLWVAGGVAVLLMITLRLRRAHTITGGK